MSQIIITPLGQMGQLGQIDISRTLEDQYAVLRAKCLENYGDSFCNSILPRSMVYAVTRRGQGYTLPWWAWMALGFAAARLIK